MSDAPAPTLAAKPTLLGGRVLLRPVRREDAAGLVELLTAPEVRRLTGTHGEVRPGVLERAREWYSSRAEEDDRLVLAIVDRAGGSYVGEIALENLDTANRSCTLRVALVGPRVFGLGYGREAVGLVVTYAFEEAGLHRVELEVLDTNPRARHVYETLGFAHEGTRREAVAWDGEWIDMHWMAALATTWRLKAR